MKKKYLRRCIVCGGKDRVIPHDDFGLCEHCEPSVEWWGGYPVLNAKPEQCPICGNTHIELDRDDECSEVDEVTAQACGIDLEDAWTADLDSQDSRFMYAYAMMVCDDEAHEDGDVWIAYKPRLYWNPVDYDFTAHKPLTPKERHQLDNKRQERAGQLRLPIEVQS